MGLSEIINLTALASSPAIFLLFLNIRTYKDTREWLNTHKIDSLWNEQSYERFRNMSLKGYLVYYLGIPGRRIAYNFHSKD